MNIRHLVFSSLLLLCSASILASEAGASTATTNLGICCICQEEMTSEQLEYGLLANGHEIYGCSDRHLFHRVCILKPDGTPVIHSCPLCRATKDQYAVAQERAALMASYSAGIPFAAPTAQIHAPLQAVPVPLQAARATLATTPTPDDVRPEIWYTVRQQLATSNNLNLDNWSITALELTALLQALPQAMREYIITLDVSMNRLTTLPDTIGQLTALQNLDAGANLLTALPDTIGQLTALQRLDVGCNQLTTLPNTIGQLTALQWLNVYDNHLTTLPDTIGQLTALKRLYVDNNHLTTLPDTIGQLTALQRLWVDSSVTIPALSPEVIIYHILPV